MRPAAISSCRLPAAGCLLAYEWECPLQPDSIPHENHVRDGEFARMRKRQE